MDRGASITTVEPHLIADRTFEVLGVRVAAVQIPDVINEMTKWIERADKYRYIAVTGMHGVVEAQKDGTVLEAINAAQLVVPDGMPLVWLGRKAGFDLPRRVYGPELMSDFCQKTGPQFKHFLYGGSLEVANKLAHILRSSNGSRIVGVHCPPFRTLTTAELEETAERINAAEPDITWVGLSTPKQELWMYHLRNRLEVPVAVGVGAAFDFLTGAKPMAPNWMRERGLEWLFRLRTEPRRLWRRYLIGGSEFLFYLLADQFRRWIRDDLLRYR